MNRLNWLHAEQQEACSSIWGQQLRRRGHQTECFQHFNEKLLFISSNEKCTKLIFSPNACFCQSRSHIVRKAVYFLTPLLQPLGFDLMSGQPSPWSLSLMLCHIFRHFLPKLPLVTFAVFPTK